MNSALLLVVATLAAAPTAKSPAPTSIATPVIASYERLYQAKKTDLAAGGLLLAGELNCTSCHQLDRALADFVHAKKAPVLSDVGNRVRPEWIRALLANPHQAKPGTTMPDMLATLPLEEKAKSVEALVHFLASTTTQTLHDANIDQGAVKRGEQLFHEVGCAACHNSQKADAKPVPFAVPLPKVDAKYTLKSLADFLRDPLKVRSSGRMPSLNLTEPEANDIASYFLKDVRGEPNFRYSFYEGRWERLPNFETMKPNETGISAGLDVGVAKRKNNFGLRFEGFLRLEKDATYTFRLSSDDGSRLSIDGTTVVDADGIHPVGDKEGKSTLKAGVHRVVVDYFDAGGDAVLNVVLRSSGNDPWRSLASVVTLTSEPAKKVDSAFQVDPQLAALGKKLFVSTGCASCHELKQGKETLAAKEPIRQFAELRDGRGCLAEEPVTDPLQTIPRYSLTAAQRSALTASLEWAQSAGKMKAKPTAKQRAESSFAAFNCYACHQRDGLGGVDPNKTVDLNDDGIPDRDPTSELLSPLFVGTTPEMGDEGRLPPRLDGVGAKLADAYLKQVLERGSKDRPYMRTVMPNFGGTNVGKLAGVLQELDAPLNDKLAVLEGPEYRAKADGRALIGTKGFGCVKCHQFNKQKAEGIQGIDMTILTRRVRPEWFAKYVRDPQSLRPGTRMPTIFVNGQSPLKETLGGNAEKQLAAMWLFLNDGEKAAIPFGVGGQPIELIADKEAIIYRNFIEGVGPRAIGVGYPEKANLAFDAGGLRLASMWHGAFVDAAKHWTGRGQGFQGPLGDDVIQLPTGVAFARLETTQQPWPTATPKELDQHFRGYRLGENRRPTFLYDLGDVHVEDTITPVKAGKQTTFSRKIALKADTVKDSQLWFRAVAAKQIAAATDGWYEIDGLWRVRVRSGQAEPVVRSGPQGQELLVPVSFADGRALVEQELVW
ncbi:MAG: c-type cytochrome [Planctomycetia bacterium]|nr:c-type cytochrome [Planctomycetia bacterium]